MFLVLFFCGLFCASHINTIRAKRQIFIHGNFTEDKLNDWQGVADRKNEEDPDLLVKILKSLGADLIESVEYFEHELTQILLIEIKDVWQRLINNYRGLTNSGDSPESLRTYMAQLLFLAKERHCESPNETFFKGKCLPISTENMSEHCPENMGLFDGPENEGLCDCLELSGENAKSELWFIYSDDTGSCHQQNTQGPCEYGQWFVMKNIAQCEPVPEGCSADGKHVYWSPVTPEPSMPKQCWEIWTQGPCEEGQRIHLAQGTEELEVYCSHLFSEFSFSDSIVRYPPCKKGSRRNRFGECTKGWFG